MAANKRPDYSYNEKTNTFRKRIQNPAGGYVDVYGKTLKELRAKVKTRETELAAAAAAVDSPFVYQYAAQWFASWSPGKGAKNTEQVRSAVNNHILPAIGSMQMVDVTEDELERVLSLTAEKSQSLNSKICRTIKAIFKSAKKSGVIPEDPSVDLSPGGIRTKEKTALTEAQQQTLLSALVGTPIYLFVFLVLHTGLRREEALGLQWDCVFLDVDHPHIEVRRALRWERNQPAINNDLKSSAARRKIPIDPELVALLRTEQVKTTGPCVFGGDKPWSNVAFRRRWEAISARSTGTETIVAEDGTETVVERKLGDKIRNHKVVVSINFPVTPHLLRHTYITRLILSGANIKVVQYLAGHASVDITLNIYSHLMDHRPEDTSATVLAAFGS